MQTNNLYFIVSKTVIALNFITDPFLDVKTEESQLQYIQKITVKPFCTLQRNYV